MSKIKPKYQYVKRKELNYYIDELIKVRDEIRKVFSAPVKEISNGKKYYLLQDLDERESFLALKIAKLKGIFKPSEN